MAHLLIEPRDEQGRRICAPLPDASWQKILRHIHDPADIYNLSNVNTLFRAIMFAKRIQEVFLPMILDHPTFRQDITPAQRFDLRSACSQWTKDIVDDYDARVLRRIRMEDPPLNSKEEKLLGIKFETVSNGEKCFGLVQYLRELRAMGRNSPIPYYCRVLQVKVSSTNDDINVFSEKLVALLTVIGHEMWMLECYFGKITDLGLVQIYSHLQRWCAQVPNLKSLGIFATWGAPYPYEDLDPVIAELPFPNLPSLELLRFNDISPYMMEKFTRLLPHIKRINVSSFQLDIHDPVLRTLRNLEGFQTNLTLLKHVNDIVKDIPWPLKTLDLCLFAVRFTTYGLFRTLEKFPLLEVLVLSGDDLKWKKEDNFLALPKLKIFKSGMRHRFTTLDFLMHCNVVERLELRFPFYSRDQNVPFNRLPERHHYIQFKGFVERMDESNVWQVLSELNSIKIELDNDTPREWKRQVSLPKVEEIQEEVVVINYW